MPVDTMVAGTLTNTPRSNVERAPMLSGYVPRNRKYLNGIRFASIWFALPRDVWMALITFVLPEVSSCVYVTPPVLILNDIFITFPVISSVITIVFGLIWDSRA